MSHLNILTISKEIQNINKNISQFKSQLHNIESNTNNIHSNIKDINEIKMNKIDSIDSLEQIRSDFKFLEKKLVSVDSCVKKLLSRNIDFVNKNTEVLHKFLKENVNLDDKQINVIIYVFECVSLQDCLMLNDRELLDFGFNQINILNLNRQCKEALENNSYPELYQASDTPMYGDNTIQFSGI
jgi:prefoldin subunit 5